VAIGAIIVELLSAWLAVVLSANQSQWTPGPTGLQVGLLLVATVAASVATVRLARVPHLSIHGARQDEAEPDWIGDAVALAKLESRWLGSLRRRAKPILDWCERSLILEVRRHPVVTAAVASAGFGVGAFGWQAYREGYVASVTLLSMGLGFCGMYADAARELFCQRGYYATAFSDVIEHSGAPRGSTYYHFPGGKRDLAREAIAAAGDEREEMVAKAAERANDPALLVRALGEMEAQRLDSSAYQRGSAIATMVLELAPDHEDLSTDFDKAPGRTWASFLRLLATWPRRSSACSTC
jgi:hypothetical protein